MTQKVIYFLLFFLPTERLNAKEKGKYSKDFKSVHQYQKLGSYFNGIEARRQLTEQKIEVWVSGESEYTAEGKKRIGVVAGR